MKTYKYGVKGGIAKGLGMWALHSVPFLSWALLVWFTSIVVHKGLALSLMEKILSPPCSMLLLLAYGLPHDTPNTRVRPLKRKRPNEATSQTTEPYGISTNCRRVLNH